MEQLAHYYMAFFVAGSVLFTLGVNADTPRKSIMWMAIGAGIFTIGMYFFHGL